MTFAFLDAGKLDFHPGKLFSRKEVFIFGIKISFPVEVFISSVRLHSEKTMLSKMPTISPKKTLH